MMDPFSIFLEKYGTFTDIQKSSFKEIEGKKNCIIAAPTGSGKTEAVFLPILRMAQGRSSGIFALYITPLKSLNRDLLNRLSALSSESGVRMAVRHGDTSLKERGEQARNPPMIMVTTPETLQNLFLSKRLRDSLKNLQVVVVDELHELYYNKRGAQLSVALERLEALAPGFQRIGISATIGNVDEACRFIFSERERVVISSSKEKSFEISIEMPARSGDPEGIKEFFSIDDAAAARIYRIAAIIKDSEATIVFANTRQAVEALGRKLLYLDKKMDFGPLSVHHGSIEKDERISTESGFKEGRFRAIVATSSLELGIDVGAVNFVVQYGSPRRATRLIQRIGRGGHKEGRVSRGEVIVSGNLEALESAAILENALNNRFERSSIEENPYDVLVNQISGLALEYGEIDSDAAFRIISGASSFRNLERKKFDQIVAFAESIGLINLREGRISIGKRSRRYFYKNISVIPEVSRYPVKNAVTNRIISYLDEKFVYSNIDEGSYFISKGMPWKVISIEDGSIFVEPGEKVEATIPDWEGEDIPVSKEVASRTYEFIEDGVGRSSAFFSKEAFAKVREFIEKQRSFFVPGEKRIVIEELEDYAIVYVALGKLGNELLARLLSYVCSYSSGGRVSAKATPYAIVLEFGLNFRKPDIKNALEEIAQMERLDSFEFIRGSDLFRYRFVKIATLFGIIDKGAKVGRGAIDRVMNFYEGSVVIEEVVRELGKNYFDLEAVQGLIDGLRSGRVSMMLKYSTGSPLTREIIQSAYSYSELLSPEFGKENAVDRLKEKLAKESLLMLCSFCGYAFEEKMDFDSDKEIRCTRCGSPMVVIYGDDKAAVIKKRSEGKPLNRGEAKLYSSIVKEAGLIGEYGNRATIALSVYGIGVDTAARVLRMLRKDYKEFFVDVLEEQRKFIKNRKFWNG